MNTNKEIKNFINYNIHPKDDPKYYDRNYSSHITNNMMNLKKLDKKELKQIIKEGLLLNNLRPKMSQLRRDIRRSNNIYARSGSTLSQPTMIQKKIKQINSNIKLENLSLLSKNNIAHPSTIVKDSSGRLAGIISKKLDYSKKVPYHVNTNPMKNRLPNWENK